jgi:hypothetical protein
MPEHPPSSVSPATPERSEAPAEPSTQQLAPEDFYFEGPNLVFTAAYHLKRGTCCGSGCRHCPYGNSA